ncbi:MAG: C-terminal target protein [Flavipsychrobacter sp.]|nr:C-terminal target protein [Flavipsychrobacter sp.]
MRLLFIILLATCFGTPAMAQFAPQAGVPGSTAIKASSSLFTGWATQCVLSRGYLNVDTPSLGTVTIGDSSNALGSVDHYIVSLGDGGVATLTFASPIYDGAGADFAIFENGFPNSANDSQAFLELAFVEVSSDGARYVRFPATSNTDLNTQIPGSGVYMYANLLNNLAGKYISNYGTPFDLQELADSPGLDISNITHVRVVDVIGTLGNRASHDINGHIINDPFPTQFATGGFDLDAVGVIHQVPVIDHTGINMLTDNISVKAYPNPATDKLTIAINGTVPQELHAVLSTITGKEVLQTEVHANTTNIAVTQLPAGMYYLTLRDANGNKWVEKVTKR